MNYKETILKNKDIKWRHPKIKYIEDGKVDLILTIPLTSILQTQAKVAFFTGISTIMRWSNENRDKPDFDELLLKQLKEWGKD